MNEIGGVSYRDVILFQTQIMMGTQFGRVMKGKDAQDLAIACLRMGWNDAFRHTSQNVKGIEKSVLEEEAEKWNKTHKESHDDFICGNILNRQEVLDAFGAFAKAEGSKGKAAVIVGRLDELKTLFKPYKMTEGDKQLSFGHFQKMFNIALKLYLCIYMCRDELALDEKRFDSEIISALENADCPIDSIILGKLDEKTEGTHKYRNLKWSKFEAEDYLRVQEQIGRLAEGGSNLSVDFREWER